MAFPGNNILNAAFSAIAKQTVSYSVYTGRTTNAAGFLVPSFAAPVPIQGSVQAVPRHKYEYMGLDFQKNYVMFYTSSPVIDLQRDVSGDKFSYGGKNYQCQSKTDWMTVDGWSSVLSVQVQ